MGINNIRCVNKSSTANILTGSKKYVPRIERHLLVFHNLLIQSLGECLVVSNFVPKKQIVISVYSYFCKGFHFGEFNLIVNPVADFGTFRAEALTICSRRSAK